MLKYLFSLILSTIAFNAAYAQVKGDTLVFYAKDNGSLVDDKTLADYVLFILPLQQVNNEKLYPVMAYYPDGKLKLTAYSHTASTNLTIEGSYISYFPNGKRSVMATCKNGTLIGDEFSYYPNGNPHTVIKHEKNKIILFECRDSTGTVLAENGNGRWIDFDKSFTNITISGTVKNGKRDGVWEIIAGTALYKNGTLVKMLSEKPIAVDAIVGRNGVESSTNDKDYLPVRSSSSGIGDLIEIQKFLNDNIKYPEEDKKNKVSGQAYVGLFVEKDGSATDFKVLLAPSATLGLEALRVAKLFAKWVPATENGKFIRTPIILPVFFSVDTLMQDVVNDTEINSLNDKPSFPGGMDAFGQFLAKALRYPVRDREKKIMGKVFTTFVVEKDGSLSHIHVVLTPSVGLAEEALRVFKASPKWIPGKVDGNPVRVSYTVPINFTLGSE